MKEKEKETDEEMGGEKVKMPREGVLDTSFFLSASKIVTEQADRLPSGFRSYDAEKFAHEIRTKISSRGGARELSRAARCFSLMTNTATFMLGPLDVPIKERKVAERRAKDKVVEAIEAETVNDLEEDMKIEATRRVEVLAEHLPKPGSSMNYWQYIFDGDEENGFGRTIENIFYSSFLVRDGHSSLSVNGSQPLISARQPPSAQEYVERSVLKHQCVLHLNYQDYLSLCRRFSSSQSYLPPPAAYIPPPSSIPTIVPSNSDSTPVISPKKRSRQSRISDFSSPPHNLHSDDDDLSQIAETPAERAPQAKRRAL